MVAIYCRVSTKQQQDQLSLDEQEQSGIAFANSLSEDYLVYKDIKSGKNIVDRDELVSLISDIGAGKIGKVWIGDVDRLTRDMEDGGKFKKLIDKHNVVLFDRGRPISSMEFSLRVVLAEEERMRIIERTKRNRKKQIDEGNNRYSSLYGYREKVIGKAKTGRIIREWVVDEEEKKMIQKIYAWYFEDLNFDQICTELIRAGYQTKRNKSWDRGTIHNILRRPEYTGRTRDSNGELVESLVYREPIIDIPTWERVQQTIDSKIRIRQGKHFRPATYDCTGIVSCAHCGARYNFHRGVRERTGEQREAYYHKQIEPKQKECSQLPKYLKRETIDYLFKALFIITFSDYERVSEYIKSEQEKIKTDSDIVAGNIKRMNAAIDELMRKQKKLVESVRDEVFTAEEVKEAMEEIRKKLSQYKKNLEEAKDQLELRNRKLGDVVAGFSEDIVQQYLVSGNKERRKLNLKYIEYARISMCVLCVRYITGKEYFVDLKSLTGPPNLAAKMVELKIADQQGKLDIICANATLEREAWMPDSVEKRKRIRASIELLQHNNFDPVSDDQYEKLISQFLISGKGRPRRQK